MRRLLRALVWLYPRAWRERYGEEFRALLEDVEPRWGDVWNVAVRALWTRSTAMKAWQWIAAGAVVGLGAHLAMLATQGTGQYRAETHMAAPGLADSKYALVKALGSKVFQDGNLLTIMDRHGLYRAERRTGRSELALHLFRQSLEVRPAGSTVTVRAVSWNPDKARAVAEDLAGLIEGEAEPYWKLQRGATTTGNSSLPWSWEIIYKDREYITHHLFGGVAAGMILGLVMTGAQAGWRRTRRR